MDFALKGFLDYVNSLDDPQLLSFDYSWESLDKIELLYEQFLEHEIASGLSEDKFITRLARYLGETLRKNMGGSWILCEEKKGL